MHHLDLGLQSQACSRGAATGLNEKKWLATHREKMNSQHRAMVLVGKLNISTARTPESSLAELARVKINVVIDITRVDFIASVGIQQLIMAAKATLHTSHKQVLLDPSPVITDVLAIARIEKYLPIVRSDEEARAVFAAAN